MSKSDISFYEFDEFVLTVQPNLKLSHNGEDCGIPPKSLQILVALLEAGRGGMSKTDLYAQFFEKAEEKHLAARLDQHIGEIRGTFEKCGKIGFDYIPRAQQGIYKFSGTVFVYRANPHPPHHREEGKGERKVAKRSMIVGLATAAAVLGVLYLIVLKGKTPPPPSNEIYLPIDNEQVRRAVLESQALELEFYKDPAKVNESQYARYWVTESQGGEEIKDVRINVNRFINTKGRISNNSKSEVLEILEVHIYPPNKDFKEKNAKVVTREKWFYQYLREDGSVEKEKIFGPYDVPYILRFINGKWLVHFSGTPRPRASPTP